MNSELLAEWIKKDADLFLSFAKGAREEEAKMAEEEKTCLEMYYKGRASAYESVLMVAYKHYLNLLLEEEKENETL